MKISKLKLIIFAAISIGIISIVAMRCSDLSNSDGLGSGSPPTPPNPIVCPGGYSSITNQAELTSISLTGNSCLNNDITLTGNWTPLGSFSGNLEARNYKIIGLSINDPTGDNQGLFATIASGGQVQNLVIQAPSIIARGNTGALAGNNVGTVTNVRVVGGSLTLSGSNTGGLVGYNNGTIQSASSSSATITTTASLVGGLVGWHDASGIIDASYATGDITGDVVNSRYIGGLVGSNDGITRNGSYATGNISGGLSAIGGLVGENIGSLSDSYATGNVSGHEIVGGLIGNDIDSTVDRSYATGNVSATSGSTGGFVGVLARGDISNSYATGSVTVGGDRTGGFVAWLKINGTITNSYSTGAVSGTTNVGGFGGENSLGGGGVITNSYFDTAMSGTTTGIATGTTTGVTGYTTASITATTDLNTWDFTTIWNFVANQWPTLQ